MKLLRQTSYSVKEKSGNRNISWMRIEIYNIRIIWRKASVEELCMVWLLDVTKKKLRMENRQLMHSHRSMQTQFANKDWGLPQDPTPMRVFKLKRRRIFCVYMTGTVFWTTVQSWCDGTCQVLQMTSRCTCTQEIRTKSSLSVYHAANATHSSRACGRSRILIAPSCSPSPRRTDLVLGH
jgi:hypothetical protein